MSVDRDELCAIASRLQDLVGVQIRSGRLIIHIGDGMAQRLEMVSFPQVVASSKPGHGLALDTPSQSRHS